MKNYYSDNYTNKLYTDAERAVYIALRARHEKSGLQFLADLQNAQRADSIARNDTHLIEYIHRKEHQHARVKKFYVYHMEQRDYCKTQAQRKTLTTAEVDAWAHKATLHDTQRAKFGRILNALDNEITNKSNKLFCGFSDRADILQDVVLFLLDFDYYAKDSIWNDSPYFTVENFDKWAVENKKRYDDSNAWHEYLQILRFKGACRVAGRAISGLATPDALTRTTTKAHKATANELAEWRRVHGENMGKGYKVPVAVRRARMSDCYDTLEYRDSKTQKGYYIVRHWTTTAPYQYIENYADEDGETDIAYLKNYNPFVNNFGDIEVIENLLLVADLTPKEEEILLAFCKYCRYYSDFQECRKKAFASCGYTSDRTIRAKWADIVAELHRAKDFLNGKVE